MARDHDTEALLKAKAEGDEARLALERARRRNLRWSEDAASGVWIVDRGGATTYANALAGEMLGHSAAELTAMPFLQVVCDADRPGVAAFLERRRKGVREQIEARCVRKDGSQLWGLIAASPTRDRNGADDGALISIMDVSERRRHLDELTASEQLLRYVVASADETIVMTDLAGTIRFLNDAARRLYGDEVRCLLGRNAYDLLAPESQEAARVGHELAWRDEVVRDRRYSVIRGDGSTIPVDMTVSLIRDGSGEPAGFMCTARDASERRRGEERTGALLDIARAISGPSQLWEILDEVHRRTATILGCDAVLTFRWNAGEERYSLLGYHAAQSDVALDLSGVDLRKDVDFVGRLAAVRTVVIEDGRNQEYLPPDLLARFGVKSLVWTQLVVRGAAVGALVALSTSAECFFSAGDVQLMEGIAQFLAFALERSDLHEVQREEREVAVALAQVGHELLCGLDDARLLDRLCALSAGVLGGQRCHTVLRDSEGDTYRVVASHGYTAEQSEWIRLVSVPGAMMTDMARSFQDTDVRFFVMSDDESGLLGKLAQDLGVEGILCMALRQGGDIIGLHVVCYDRQEPPASRAAMRIASGLAELASVALRYRVMVEALERASRLRSDYVAAVSHELRGPLNVIAGYGSLLLDKEFGDLGPDQAGIIARMNQSASLLLELIASMLDLGRIEAGKAQVDWQDVRLADVFSAVENDVYELCQRRPNVRLEFLLEGGAGVVRSDPLKLKVIVNNLVTNALKFTDSGSVRVTARALEQGTEIEVADTGVGIPPTALSKVFEAFSQAPGTPARHGGVGLGLYIVKQLAATLLGGTIMVRSTEGEGTTFVLLLPTPRA